MSSLARLLIIFAIVAGATAVMLFFGGFASPVSISFRLATPTPPPAFTISAPAKTVATPATAIAEAAVETNASAPPPLEVNRIFPAWERQIELAATDLGKSETERALAVLALLHALPEEALAAAAERAVDALPDADYAAVALPVVTNPRTHNRAMSVLFADLMERPDAITLPTLLQIARNPAHAFAPAAKDNLQLLLGADFGADWTRWDAEIQRMLAREKR